MGGKWLTIKEIGGYSAKRISAQELNEENYIGVDNLLQNKQGRTSSNYVPKIGNYTKYEIGNILIGNIRPYLKKIWFATNEGGTSGDVLVIQISENNTQRIIPKYLYYHLSSDDFFNFNIQYAKGAKMPRGNKNKIIDYKIPIPPLEEQERIVSILDKFDTLVNSISEGLPKEIELRQKQYEYYRNKLLSF